MRKKSILILCLLIVVLGGAAALALAGSLQDPLVSLEYLTKKFQPSVLTEVKGKADTAHQKTYDAAQKKLDAEAERVRARLNTSKGSKDSSNAAYLGQFTPKKYSYGDTISLTAGSGFLFLEGAGEAKAQNGELINVTKGTAATSMTLQTACRYLIAEGATVTVTVSSEAAILAPIANAKHTASGTTALPFTDLLRDEWYYAAILFAYEKKLFNGISEDWFSPSGSVTRGMLATVLHRLAGEPNPSGGDAAFTDVPAGEWFDKGIRWSAQAGIVKGMGDGTFAPDLNVTREQLAAMLYRYADDYANLNMEATGDLSQFSDTKRVSSWAEDALSWTVGAGILNGDDGALKPGASASRAEAATMLQRFSTLLS